VSQNIPQCTTTTTTTYTCNSSSSTRNPMRCSASSNSRLLMVPSRFTSKSLKGDRRSMLRTCTIPSRKRKKALVMVRHCIQYDRYWKVTQPVQRVQRVTQPVQRATQVTLPIQQVTQPVQRATQVPQPVQPVTHTSSTILYHTGFTYPSLDSSQFPQPRPQPPFQIRQVFVLGA
jgi:hypothetical protein